jgi:two-component system phosphate regulon sensor histidine kinase PhoR
LSDLIEISRIESGDMKMSFRYFEVVSFLQQVGQEMGDSFTAKQQHLVLELPEKEIMVYGDKDRLKMAVNNILDNASKYSPNGATTTVRVLEEQASVTLSIADGGPGIEQEHLPRVFERFYRVDKTRSRDVGGTGLGLAIVKHIVEAHGSKVSVVSKVGQGTTFSFELRK